MRLTTSRLLLREFEESDWEAVLSYQSDPLYLRYYAWEQRTEPDVREFVRRFIDQQQERPRIRFQLGIVLRSDGRLIGNCGLRVNDPDLREGDIGFELDSRYWGQGYATEAAREMLRVGFEEQRLHRIRADCVAENVGSARVLEKIGMRLEGRLREKTFYRRRWWDILLYAALDQEWQARYPPQNAGRHEARVQGSTDR